MQRFLLTACAGLVAAAVATPSLAADLPRPAYKAAPAVYVAPFSWSGFYVGLNAGYGWGNTTWTNVLSTSGSFRTTGTLIGGTLGYNLQTGSWVWGLEGDLGWSNIKGSSTSGLYCSLQAGCETKNTWLGTFRGRIGYAWDRWMPYLTGGLAFGSVRMTPPAIFGSGETKTKTGYALGVGAEYAFMGAWSAKLEYLYVDLGTSSCSAANCFVATDVKFNTSLLRLGVNYRF